MQFLIIHGSFGSPESNWFPQLKESLESFKQKVILPRFPVDDWDQLTQKGEGSTTTNQTLENWLKTLEPYVNQIKSEPTVVVAHSLGPLFILHAIEKFALTFDCGIFVSPFLEKLHKSWQIDAANATFYKTDFNYSHLKISVPLSYVIYSENDPYVDTKYIIKFVQKMASTSIPVKNAGHFNSQVNLNEFPLVLELCKSRLDLTLYQKYLAHRRELYAIDYARQESEEVIYIPPQEVFDEGTFHFRNLQKSGFATLFTGITDWDDKVHARYFEEARKAAKRMGNFTRVYIYQKPTDLARPQLKEHIQLDLDAGVKCYACNFNDIKDEISEPDFGIWDEDYVCIVSSDKLGNISQVKLTSRQQDLDMAHKWQQRILEKSQPINPQNS
jgi:uncharacterized protein